MRKNEPEIKQQIFKNIPPGISFIGNKMDRKRNWFPGSLQIKSQG